MTNTSEVAGGPGPDHRTADLPSWIRLDPARRIHVAGGAGSDGSTSVQVLEATRTALDDCDAGRLGWPPGSPAWRVTRRWTVDGHGLVATVDILPLPDGVEAPAVGASLAEAVARVTDTVPRWEMVRPDAVSADEETARLCGVGVGRPLLRMDVIGVAVTGKRLYRSCELYRPGTSGFDLVRVVGPERSSRPAGPGRGVRSRRPGEGTREQRRT